MYCIDNKDYTEKDGAFMMTYDEIRENLTDGLSNMTDDEMLDTFYQWNDDNCYDDQWYPMYEFDDMCSGMTPTEIADNVDSDFNTGDDFFQFDIYGLKSGSVYDVRDDFNDNLDDIADWLVYHDEDLARELIENENPDVTDEDLEEFFN